MNKNNFLKSLIVAGSFTFNSFCSSNSSCSSSTAHYNDQVSSSSRSSKVRPQDIQGWHFYNSTNTALIVKSFVDSREISITIRPRAREFIGATDKDSHITVKKNIEEEFDDEVARSVSLKDLPEMFHSDHVQCPVLIIQENHGYLANQERLDILDSASSLLLCNRTSYSNSKKIYYAWYYEDCGKKKRLTLPREIGDCGHCETICSPKDDGNNRDKIALVLGVGNDTLLTNSFTKSCCSTSLKQLQKNSSKEFVLTGGDAQDFSLEQENEHRAIINATNLDLFCSLFKYEKGRAIQRIESGSHLLKAQKRSLLPMIKGTVRFVVTKNTISVNGLNSETLPPDVHIYEFPKNVQKDIADQNIRTYVIHNSLDDKNCSFAVKPSSQLFLNVLPYIFQSFEKSKKIFTMRALAEIEKELPTRPAQVQNGLVAERKIHALEKEQACIKTRQKTVWKGIIPLLGQKAFTDLVKRGNPQLTGKKLEWQELVNEQGEKNLKNLIKNAYPHLDLKHKEFKEPEIKRLLGEEALKELVIVLDPGYGRRSIDKILERFSPPVLAFIPAGGDSRAMIDTIGFLEAAEEIKLLDCITYVCGLSGATWPLAAWIASGKPIKEFADDQCEKLNKLAVAESSSPNMIAGSVGDLMFKVAPDAHFIRRSLIQSRFNQPQGLIGFYGHALAHVLLDGFCINNKRTHDITFSDLQKHLAGGEYPLPICSAVELNKAQVTSRRWFDFTPFYVSTYKTGIGGNNEVIHVETPFFGSVFKNGQLMHWAPEYPLAQLMGIWGSAYAVDSASMKDQTDKGGSLLDGLQCFDKKALQSVKKVFPDLKTDNPDSKIGYVPNYLYIPQEHVSAHADISEREKLFFLDAGLSLTKGSAHNLATIPVLARNVDLIILCGSKNSTHEGSPQDLVAVVKEAGNLALPFPTVLPTDFDKLTDPARQSVLIEGDGGERIVPKVVYIKGEKSGSMEKDFGDDEVVDPIGKETCFGYKSKDFEMLKNLAADKLRCQQTKDTILEAIEKAVKVALKKVVENTD